MNELIERFGQVAWEAAMRQVQVDIWFNVFAGVLILFIAPVVLCVLWKPAKRDDVLPALVSLVLLLAIVAIIPLGIALKQSLNPEFYAIEKFIPGKR